MKRKEPESQLADEVDGAAEHVGAHGCVACEDYSVIFKRRFSLAKSTHCYRATEVCWTGRRHSYTTLHYPCCGLGENSFCTGAFVGSQFHPGKLRGGPHNMHCRMKGGVGGPQLTWDCCKAISVVSGCDARPSGAFNSNYEMTNKPSGLDIAGSLVSIKLLRQRIEAHAKCIDGAGLIATMSAADEEECQKMWPILISSRKSTELYGEIREDAKILLHLFEHKLIPYYVRSFGSESGCIHNAQGKSARRFRAQ